MKFEWLLLATGALGAIACGRAQTDDESGGGAEAGTKPVGGASGNGGEPSGGSAGSDGATGGSNAGGSEATGGSQATGGSAERGGTAGAVGVAGNGGVGAGGTGGMGASAGTGGSGGSGGRPLSMFVMFDRSGSMRECPDGFLTDVPFSCPSPDNGPNRWDNAALGLTAFFQDPTLAGIGVALRLFPHDVPTPGCTSDTTTGCDAEACSHTLVPLVADSITQLPKLTAGAAPADAHEGALAAAIANSYPMAPVMAGTSTGGPTHPALIGAHTWAGTYQAAHPTEETIVVLVTDGLPNGCGEDVDAIAFVAAGGFAMSGVETHVIGLGDPEAEFVNFLNAIALAGGTSEAVMIADSATANADLLAALNAIRDRY